MSITFGNWFNTDASQSIESLNSLITGAEQSIECAFSDLDTGNSLEFISKVNARQKSVKNLAQNIIRKKNVGLEVSVIFDADQKCISSGALFFQYPDYHNENRFLDGASVNLIHKDLINDCNDPAKISSKILPQARLNSLLENRELYFTNTIGVMANNVCVIDKKRIWFSMGPLNDDLALIPSISFILDPGDNSIAQEFTKEIAMLKNNLSGSFKKPYQVRRDYRINESTWRIVHGPQDKPLEYLAEAISSSESMHLYSSGMDYDLNNPVVNSLINQIQTKKNINLLFSNTGIFSPSSFFQSFFISGKYCLNSPEFCKNQLQYMNLAQGVGFNHLFLIQDKYGKKKVLFFNGDLNKPGVDRSDTILIEIESPVIYDSLLNGWHFLSNKSMSVANTYSASVLPMPGEVSITEIVWMGSVDNLRNAHTSDEAIEIYNTTNKIIDLGGISIACTNSITGNIASSIFSIPRGVILMPNQYFSISSRLDGAFPRVNMKLPDLSIGNTTRQCLMVDNRAPSATYYPTGSLYGHYNDANLQGVIIDQVLEYTQDPWNSNAFQFFSKTGLNTIKYNIEGEGARSMEKIYTGANGKLLSSWHTNTFTPGQNNVSDGYIYHTFASLGYENSPSPTVSDGSVVVTEIHWMGSYDLFGVSNASDEFIEIFNRSLDLKNIGGWIFGCSTDIAGAAGKPFFGIPYGTIIQPGQYLTIQKIGSSAFLNADLTLDFTLSNMITQCLLTDANVDATVYEGSDANSDGVVSGHYDNPLFSGYTADVISNRSATFAALGLGINDTTNKIRRSSERINTGLSGNLPGNWRANLITDPALNAGIDPKYRSNTFASPGYINSN